MSRFEPVLHSVSYAGAWPGHTLLKVEAFLDKAEELGFESIALVAKRPHVSPFDYGAEDRRRLKAEIRRRGLKLEALMGYTDFTAAIDRPGIPSGEMNAGYVEALARLAADLECTRLRVFTGYERSGASYDAQYGELVKGLRLAGRAAAPYQVTLMVQNHHDLAVHHRQLAWLLREVGEPNVKCAFDAWSPFLQGLHGESLSEAVLEVGPFIEWTTVADYRLHPRFRYQPDLVNYARQPDVVRAVPCGDGEVDYRSFFAGLTAAGYSGPVAYEMCAVLEGGGSCENLDRTALRFRDWLEQFG